MVYLLFLIKCYELIIVNLKFMFPVIFYEQIPVYYISYILIYGGKIAELFMLLWTINIPFIEVYFQN